MRLELKHLAPYLPYQLEVINNVNRKSELTLDNFNYYIDKGVKPILRPLSDLKDFSRAIWKYGMLENEEQPTLKLSYNEISVLFENHFDVFGLIPNNLAIDINTLK